MSTTDTEYAVAEASYAPEPDLAQRLSYGLDMIGAPELAGLIASAGLAAVYEQLQRTRTMLGETVHAEMAVGLQIAHLTDEARRWKRRWAGAVAQARREHARAETLQSIVGLHELSDRMDERHRAKLQEKHDQLLAVLHDVLASFTKKGHPGYAALSSGWVEVQRVEAWRAVLSPTPERPWWEQLKDLRDENEQLRTELADYRLAESERQGAEAREQRWDHVLYAAAGQQPTPEQLAAVKASGVLDRLAPGTHLTAAHVNQAIDQMRRSTDGWRLGVTDSIKALEEAHLCRECGSAPEVILEHLLETTTAEHADEASER